MGESGDPKGKDIKYVSTSFTLDKLPTRLSLILLCIPSIRTCLLTSYPSYDVVSFQLSINIEMTVYNILLMSIALFWLGKQWVLTSYYTQLSRSLCTTKTIGLREWKGNQSVTPLGYQGQPVEYFTISNCVRSDRPRSQHLLSAFVGIKYLLVHTNCGKCQSPQITFSCTNLNCDNS